VWLKIDDRIVDHPKMFAAARHLGRRGHARAFGVYMAGLCYANGHLTDGFLAESVVESFKIDRTPTEVAQVLAFPEIGLWENVAGGWRIHDYHQFNPKAADVKEKLAADRDRKREERAGKSGPGNGRTCTNRSQIDHESVANRSEIDRGFAFFSAVTNSDQSPETVDSISEGLPCPDGIRPESSALARARSRPDPVPCTERSRRAPRVARGKPVENAPRVLRALVWSEVREIFRQGAPTARDPATGRRVVDSFEIRERLKDRAAAAGLIYAVEDFHNQAELAIARYSSDAGAAQRDADRTAWRQAGRPSR
jgi:hypothetical protein